MSNNLGMRGAAKVLLAASGLVGLAACGGDDPSHWPAERPRIDSVTYAGQSPSDALGLRFTVTFVDEDGDLGQGNLQLYLGEASAGSIGLPQLFAAQTPPLDAGATEGEFEVLVRLSEAPTSGEKITVAFELEDAAGNRSNKPSLTLATLAPGGT